MIDRIIDRRRGFCLVRIAILAVGFLVVAISTRWICETRAGPGNEGSASPAAEE